MPEGTEDAVLTGREALRVVAKDRGHWNWAFVGPDPQELPLAGCGAGSVDEMRECLAEHGSTVLFGLLRVAFGTGRLRRTRWVCVVASTVDEDFQEPQAQEAVAKAGALHGRAVGKRPAMERALAEFAHFVAVVEVTSMGELTVEEVIERVRKVAVVDAEDLSAEAFRAAQADFCRTAEGQAPPPPAAAPAAPAAEAAVAEAQAPAPAGAEAESPAAAAREPEASGPAAWLQEHTLRLCDRGAEAAFASRLRLLDPEAHSSVRAALEALNLGSAECPEGFCAVHSAEKGGVWLLRRADRLQAALDAVGPLGRPPAERPAWLSKGARVEVWSSSERRWATDGVVDEVLLSEGAHDGAQLVAGSVKVLYCGGARGKWLSPEQCEAFLRPFEFKPPPKLAGPLLKETHNFFAEWHVRYFELRAGFLTWWLSAADAVKGTKPQGNLELLDMRLQRSSPSATTFRLRTAGSRGVVYHLDANVGEDGPGTEAWLAALREHAAFRLQSRGS